MTTLTLKELQEARAEFQAKVASQGREFIVLVPSGFYVEAVSQADGDIDFTKDKSLARIFHGESWARFWQGRGCALEFLPKSCSQYYSAFTGLVKCPCKPLRVITYVSLSGDPVSGDYCARHAIELKRREAKGELEIMADEPLYPELFDKPAAGREIGMKGFYGVGR